MLKIFRKVRQKMIKNNKVTSYLLYAIGEIALVMIGILLALQVNNWNEKRKQKTELNNILQTVAYDLETDTLVAGQVARLYDTLQVKSNIIINKQLKKENYRDCIECASLTTFYTPFNIQTKGFELLKNISSEATNQKDSLIISIIQIYSLYNPIIEKNNERLENEVMKNLNELREYSWFVDLSQGKFNEDMVIYFTESEDYRKRVALHNMLATNNHLVLAKNYKAQATELLKRIYLRLKNENQ
ncbi:MAG: DUF6090 family protein [Flavobacteriaceae bacterium]